jgi:cytochrome b561
MNPAPPPPRTYGAVAMSLHWLVALGVIATFGLGWVMTDIPGITPTKLKYFNWHKWLGVTLFALSLLRILWRAFHMPPPHAIALSRFQHLAARGMHLGLYAATLAVPLSGYLYTLAAGYPVVYLGLFQLPVLFAKSPEWIAPLKTLHAVCAYAMAAAVVMHAAAALVHHFRDRDDVLLRMLPRFLSRSPRA